jgi:hypothetical protein
MKNHQIKLIDTTYSVDDAAEMLLSLIKDKIKFLNMKTFSEGLRFGSTADHLEKRIHELKEEVQVLSSLLNNPEYADSEVEIECFINLKIKQPELAQ